MRRVLFILFIVLFGFVRLSACDCYWSGNFLEVAKRTDIIVLVQVKEYNNFFALEGAAPMAVNQPLSATLEIVEVISGAEKRVEIEAFGDSGYLCRPYIDNLKIGQYYILALDKSLGINHGNGINETSNDYVLYGCGEFWIDYDITSQNANGWISKSKRRHKKREMQFIELKKRLGAEKAEAKY